MSLRHDALELTRELAKGCGDSGCRFRRPTGMATNGGCRCHEKVHDALLVAHAAELALLREAAHRHVTMGHAKHCAGAVCEVADCQKCCRCGFNEARQAIKEYRR